jgi:hypothetical protein
MRKQKQKNPHAVALGKLGGSVRSKAKKLANKEKRKKGWSGQKPQENFGGPAQCTAATAWTPQRLNLLIEVIRARFGHCAIGRDNSGIKYSSATLGQG